MNRRVLFVDDDREFSRVLIRSLERELDSVELLHTATAAEARDKLEGAALIVLDLELDPDAGPQSGLELIPEFAGNARVIVLTGHGSEEFGLEALRKGAVSFLTKPVEPRHLKALIEDSLEYAQLKARLKELEAEFSSSIPAVGLSSRDGRMRAVLKEIKFAASTAQPLLLLGETGTGKGVIARAVHDLSPSAHKPFVRAQPAYGNFDLVQSELFGHERGSFTGAVTERKGLIEEANGGTLFLDEIDSLPRETQVMLLEVVQERKFRRVGSNRERSSSFRLIAASNRDKDELKQLIRQDLFHRLAHLVITIPPLRERQEDIEFLAVEMLSRISDTNRLKVNSFSPESLIKLRQYSYPGNLRELNAIVEQAAFRARFNERSIIEAEDVNVEQNSTQGISDFRTQVNAFEAKLLKQALNAAGQNLSEAARTLGVERTQLRRMLKRHRLIP